jgi:plasmid stabilization system protein ParE
MRLRYSPSALADLEAILAYIDARSPQGARKVQARIQAIMDLLLQFPMIGTRTDDLAIRRMTVSPLPYLILLRGDRRRDHHPCRPARRAKIFQSARIDACHRPRSATARGIAASIDCNAGDDADRRVAAAGERPQDCLGRFAITRLDRDIELS